MAQKLMVCSKCLTMFRVDVARTPEEEIRCPSCSSSEITGLYQYWRGVSTSAGFKARGPVKALDALGKRVKDQDPDQGSE